MHELTAHFIEHMHTPAGMALHGFLSLPFLLAASGVMLAWFFYTKRPDIPAAIQKRFGFIHQYFRK